MPQFRKRPIVIEAVQWTGNNFSEIQHLNPKVEISLGANRETLLVNTLQGWVAARKGDWVIRGVAGELYPCRAEIFAETYAEADSRDDFPVAAVKHLARCNCHCQRNGEDSRKNVHLRSCWVGKAQDYLGERVTWSP